MPAVYLIRFTRDAAGQLRDIFNFIEQDSPQNSSRMMARIVKAIDALSQFPHRYKVLENIKTYGEEVRSMPVPPYLVRYHVDDARVCVTILSVRHGSRRPGL
jgi:plasmid stabilization system protein ParE